MKAAKFPPKAVKVKYYTDCLYLQQELKAALSLRLYLTIASDTGSPQLMTETPFEVIMVSPGGYLQARFKVPMLSPAIT